MANNPISKSSVEWLGSSPRIETITPHATNTFEACRAISVNADGDVTLRPVQSESDVTIHMLAGAIYPVSANAVRITGTDATGINAWY